jgi:hypothetical protein
MNEPGADGVGHVDLALPPARRTLRCELTDRAGAIVEGDETLC